MNEFGVESPATDEITIKPLYDVTKPTCSISAPQDGALVKGPITVSGTASDGAGVGVSYVEMTADNGILWKKATGTETWTTTWTPPRDGNYALKCRAADYAGNIEQPVSRVNIIVQKDLADAIKILQIIGGMDLSDQGITIDYDVTGDGKIGLEEVINILQRIVGLR